MRKGREAIAAIATIRDILSRSVLDRSCDRSSSRDNAYPYPYRRREKGKEREKTIVLARRLCHLYSRHRASNLYLPHQRYYLGRRFIWPACAINFAVHFHTDSGDSRPPVRVHVRVRLVGHPLPVQVYPARSLWTPSHHRIFTGRGLRAVPTLISCHCPWQTRRERERETRRPERRRRSARSRNFQTENPFVKFNSTKDFLEFFYETLLNFKLCLFFFFNWSKPNFFSACCL